MSPARQARLRRTLAAAACVLAVAGAGSAVVGQAQARGRLVAARTAPARLGPGRTVRPFVPRPTGFPALPVGVGPVRTCRPGQVRTTTLPDAGAPGGVRPVWVYRPAVPDSAGLPVVYFLHGLPGRYEDLAEAGGQAAADTAACQTAAMVVVATDGNSAGYSDTEWGDDQHGAFAVESFLTGPLLQAVEGEHPRDPAHRSLLGFSMGGSAAVSLAERHPDIYGAAVSLDGYFHVDDPDHVFADPAAHDPGQLLDQARRLRLLLADGQADDDPVTTGETARYGAALHAAGIPATVETTPGGHDLAYLHDQLPAALTFLAG